MNDFLRPLTEQKWRRLCSVAGLPLLLATVLARQAGAVEGISDSALQQIVALQAEKATRSAALQKVESQLIYALKRSLNQQYASGITNLSFVPIPDGNGRMRVDITATVTPDLLTFMTQAGCQFVNNFPQFQAIQALVPLTQLEAVAGRSEVFFIQLAGNPVAWTGPV